VVWKLQFHETLFTSLSPSFSGFEGHVRRALGMDIGTEIELKITVYVGEKISEGPVRRALGMDTGTRIELKITVYVGEKNSVELNFFFSYGNSGAAEQGRNEMHTFQIMSASFVCK
jgi:hypothetical protein